MTDADQEHVVIALAELAAMRRHIRRIPIYTLSVCRPARGLRRHYDAALAQYAAVERRRLTPRA